MRDYLVARGIPVTRLALRRWGVCPVYSRHARFNEWRDLYSLAREVPAVVEYQLRPL